MKNKMNELEIELKYHETKISELRKQIAEIKHNKLKEKSIVDRIVYAAYSRCPCGAGLAYDPCFEDGPLSGYWDCSDILLGIANTEVKHTGQLPFTFYEILSEQQPSARGSTTRNKNDVDLI